MKMTGIKWVTLLVLVFGAVSVSAQSDLTVKVKNIRCVERSTRREMQIVCVPR